jgi:hypothetical protein
MQAAPGTLYPVPAVASPCSSLTRLSCLLQIYTVSVSPYLGGSRPSRSGGLRGDFAVSFSCDPEAAWTLVSRRTDMRATAAPSLDEAAERPAARHVAMECAVAAAG